MVTNWWLSKLICSQRKLTYLPEGCNFIFYLWGLLYFRWKYSENIIPKTEQILIKYVHFNAFALCTFNLKILCKFLWIAAITNIIFQSLYLFKIKVALGKMIAEIILLMLRIFLSTGYIMYLVRLVWSAEFYELRFCYELLLNMVR